MHGTVHERRREDRESPRTIVRVAYARGGLLPSDRNLEQVECHNLSRSGFAYWMLSPPDHNDLLVVFGETPNEVRVRARVVHCEVAEHKGRLRTLGGCQFWGRL